jgi:hypothetical protein
MHADGQTRSFVRELADQAFSRASGAPLRDGNSIVLLKDATQNYPAWLDAIRSSRRTIHFEVYILHEDDTGRLFADALIKKAGEGVRVRLLYDWLGAFGTTSHRFWNRLRAAGMDTRCYNPLRFDHPLGWVRGRADRQYRRRGAHESTGPRADRGAHRVNSRIGSVGVRAAGDQVPARVLVSDRSDSRLGGRGIDLSRNRVAPPQADTVTRDSDDIS